MRDRLTTGGGFALLGEVLLTGVAVTLLVLPVLTLPAALAAGIGHLRRYVADEGSPFAAFWRDARAAAAGGVAVAVAALATVTAAILAIGLAGADPTPAGTVMGLVGRLAVGIVATAVVMAAGAWTSDGGWRSAVRGLRDQLDADPSAALHVFVAVALTAVLTWQFPLLLVPSLGVVAFAVVAVQRRSRVP
ncbi:hypothetical protein [Catellatospora citrea]|uniref:Uncharacterized protein n=1 Tax=Catellatospora citrea TaxID=53366 RepID=A0A8J3KHJ1_9ACTN|nr:hypothetical protein [Catellatospora citrea]RKE05707.1 hypothetical protein C8E86_0517 [Catellatospora citrea]GIF97068.1 hypothetical protein Cci01nite_21620 [Catellatospora citrea]